MVPQQRPQPDLDSAKRHPARWAALLGLVAALFLVDMTSARGASFGGKNWLGTWTDGKIAPVTERSVKAARTMQRISLVIVKLTELADR